MTQKQGLIYDVFLCYNSRDRAQVRTVAAALRRSGLLTWLDQEESEPGRVWYESVERVLTTARAVAVFVGPHGPGDTALREAWVALNETVRRDIPVIPVLLPGAEESALPHFLRTLAWVDMRDGHWEPALARLVKGIVTSPIPSAVHGRRGAYAGTAAGTAAGDSAAQADSGGVSKGRAAQGGLHGAAAVAALNGEEASGNGHGPVDEVDGALDERTRRRREVLALLALAGVAEALCLALRVPEAALEPLADILFRMVEDEPLALICSLVDADKRLQLGATRKSPAHGHPYLQIFASLHPLSTIPWRSMQGGASTMADVRSTSGMSAESHMAGLDRRNSEWERNRRFLLVGRRAVPPGPEMGMAEVDLVAATARHIARLEGLDDSDSLIADVRGRLQVRDTYFRRLDWRDAYPYYALVSDPHDANVLRDGMPELRVVQVPEKRDPSGAALMQALTDLMERRNPSLGVE